MADDNSYQANQDVIAGARAIRSNPAALAQLVPLLNPPPRADPAGALATSRSSVPNMSDAMVGSAMMPGGGPLGSAPSTSSVRALTNALASTLMPPVRPTDLDAINALVSPPAASAPMDPSIDARVAALSSPSPQSVPMDPSIAARAGAMANPPVGPDPWMSGAAAQSSPWNAPMQNLAPVASQGGPWESPLPVRGAIASPPPSSQAPAWQPPATDRIVGSNPFDAVDPPQSARWQNAPVVGAPVVVQGPNGAVVSFPDGTDPATVDQVMGQNFSGRGGSSPNSQQQGDASQWGPLQEGVNSFMFGAGPAVNEWLGKNAPTWMLSGAQPTTASQEQANRDAYAAQNPGTTFAADVAGGSLPFLATGGAASGLGLAGRMGVAGLTAI